MFKKLQIIAILIFIFGAIMANAQAVVSEDSTVSSSSKKKSATDEFTKNEFYGGYSFQSFEASPRDNIHGFEIAYTRNVRRFVGIKTDFAYRLANLNCPECGVGGAEKRYQASLQGGVQIKDNAKDTRLKPFGHILTGWAQNGNKLCNSSNNCGNRAKVNQFSMTFGGGLDVKISNKIALRVVQIDYNPTFSEGFTYNNINVGVGIVIL